jgi:hypothetical protein
MAKQGHKISFLKILNYTSPPPLINYDQSLILQKPLFSVKSSFLRSKVVYL